MREPFGRAYSRMYDSFYRDKDYAKEVDLLESVFAGRKVRRVLDLGCGTGGHAVELAARGYGVVGVDKSTAMLDIARAKTGSLKAAPRFVQGDARHLDLAEQFDAAIAMFAVVGYQHRDEDVAAMFEAVGAHVRKGGVFIFDVWFGPAVKNIEPSDRVLVREESGVDVVRISSGTVREEGDLCDVRVGVWEVCGDRVGSSTSEVHTMRFFFPDRLEEFLRDAGLRLERIESFPEIDQPPSDETWNVMVVASKP